MQVIYRYCNFEMRDDAEDTIIIKCEAE